MSLLIAECLSDCSRAVLARTAAISDVAAASRPQNSDASESVADVDEAKHYGPDIMAAFDLMDTRTGEDTSSPLLYKLPNGTSVSLKGWRQEMRGGAEVIIGPQGDEYTSMQYAYEALQLEQQGTTGSGRATLKAMSKILAEFKEGPCTEPASTPLPSGEVASGVAKEAEWPKHYAKGFALSQLDDWLHRGKHDIVRHMSLYIYSIWVSRVELLSPALTPNHLNLLFPDWNASGS
jgi:hypothetical protein